MSSLPDQPHPLLWRAAGAELNGERMQSAFWGVATATLDFCERNFQSCASLSACETAIAEYWNVVSSLAMALLGLYGAVRGVRIGLAPRIILGYASLVAVGLGSAAFHASLRFELQAMDELPMLLGNCVFLYCVAPKAWRSTAARRLAVGGGLAALFALVSTVYLRTHNALFFEASYGAGTVLLAVRCGVWAYRNREERNPRAAPARRLVVVATASMLLAFALWNVENVFCLKLRAVQDLVGPLEFLFQLHAWWHLLAALAAWYLGTLVVVIDPDEDVELGVVPAQLASGRQSARLAAKRRAAAPGSGDSAYEVAYAWFGLPLAVPVAPLDGKRAE